MSQDKRWIRYCLLLMQEEEQSLFEIDKGTLGNFYQNQVDKFIQDKKRQKEKELKEIEKEKIKEKRQKEIEELKKKNIKKVLYLLTNPYLLSQNKKLLLI